MTSNNEQPKRIFVAGHRGMVGSSLCRALSLDKNNKLLIADRNEVDLRNTDQVLNFFKDNNIEEVYLAAAKVGGIHANDTFPADFIYDNLMIEANIINASHASSVKKLLFLGSSCIYPKHAKQPMDEPQLLTGPLEPTNEPYAIAKITGIKLCESYYRQYGSDFRSVMPTNLYGPGDNYHPQNSHVIPALIRRIHEAKESNSNKVTIWGTGTPKREFLYVEDLAKACIHIMSLEKEEFWQKVNDRCSHVNIGYGEDISIKEVASKICKIIGFKGELEFDTSKPDGTPRKLLDCSLINKMGWSANISLEQGLTLAYSDFKSRL